MTFFVPPVPVTGLPIAGVAWSRRTRPWSRTCSPTGTRRSRCGTS